MTKVTRKIQLHVERSEHWYPTVEVPVQMSDDEALEIIQDYFSCFNQNLVPKEVYIEYSNKKTYDYAFLSTKVHCHFDDETEVEYSLVDEETI